MVGGQAGGGYTEIGETNDMSLTPIEGLPQALGKEAPAGVGGISMEQSSDAFFLHSPFQANRVELAYLVARTTDAKAGGFTMSLGVLGDGITNSGQPGGAQWGGSENPAPLTIALPPPTPQMLALDIRRTVGGIDISFTAQPGRIYSLQYSRALGPWQTIAMDLCGKVRFEDRDATRMARKTGFYRTEEQ